jgi:hypothetical protein
MRVENWDPSSMDEIFENVAIERLVEAAGVVAESARQKCPVGTISHPMYKRGKYAGKDWTSRDAGRLRKSIRVVQKKTAGGKALSKKRNVRVYSGHYLAWYASIVEFYTPFMRPALINSIPEIKAIVGATG